MLRRVGHSLSSSKWLNDMSKIFSLILLATLLQLTVSGQESRVVLVANLRSESPLVNEHKDAFIKSLTEQPNTRLILMGDCELSGPVADLLETIDSKNIKTVCIPGNEDWQEVGLEENPLSAAENYLENTLKHATLLPKDACPGPLVFYENSNVVLVAINSQWWLQKGRKQTSVDSDCKSITSHQITEELNEIIEEHEHQQVVILAHHPVFSTGLYGGGSSFKAHFFPFIHNDPNSKKFLPIFGSFYHYYRQNQGGTQDHNNAAYRTYISDIVKALEPHNNVLFCSGSEYNTQLHQVAGSYHLNAGAGTYTTRASKAKELLYKSRQTGFAVVDIQNEESLVKLYAIENGQVQLAHTEKIQRHKMEAASAESVLESAALDTLVVGGAYKAGFIKRAFLGSLYRTSWSDSVRIPFLDLDTAHGGLDAFSIGGGRQTTSLKFVASSGQTFVFRSVDKNPVKALPLSFRGSFLEHLAKDMTATQHPYGALVVANLLDHTSILHAHPTLFVLPSSTHLHQFNTRYSGLFGMLEEKPWNPSDSLVGFGGSDKIVNTLKLFSMMYNSPKHQIDTAEFLKARVFDIMVGDWGRHEDNWKWAKYKQADRNYYRPIPRDRDHTFSHWNGLFPYLADRRWARPNTENFGKRFSDIKSLTWQNRHYDRYLLSSATKADFLTAAQELKRNISPDDISTSIKSLPKEIIPVSGNTIEEKLINRRENLETAAAKYYALLAKSVDVVGTNKKEKISIVSQDGKLTVKVVSTKRKQTIFERTFFANETHEVNVYGLDGNDEFVIEGAQKSKIRIRIVPGNGDDKIKLKEGANTSKITVYTATSMAINPRLKVVVSDDIFYSEFNRTKFRYNTYLPYPIISSNSDDGFRFGGGVSIKEHGYDYKDYKSTRGFNASQSTEGSLLINASYEHYLPRSKWSLGAQANYGDYFAFYNYFGIGNASEKVDSLDDLNYYLTRLSGVRIAEYAKLRFLQSSSITLSIHQEFLADETILNVETFDESVGFVTARNLIGAKQKLDLDFTDSEIFTSKGIRVLAEHSVFDNPELDNSFGKTALSLSHYSSFRLFLPLTLKLELGLERSYGADIPYYHLPSLGQTHKLRGYLTDRFRGESLNYFNTDLRIHLGKNKSNVLPLYYGLNLFLDGGQIVDPGPRNTNWHYGYGAGFYVSPISEELLTLQFNVATSEEESILFQFGLGLFIR